MAQICFPVAASVRYWYYASAAGRCRPLCSVAELPDDAAVGIRSYADPRTPPTRRMVAMALFDSRDWGQRISSTACSGERWLSDIARVREDTSSQLGVLLFHIRAGSGALNRRDRAETPNPGLATSRLRVHSVGSASSQAWG